MGLHISIFYKTTYLNSSVSETIENENIFTNYSLDNIEIDRKNNSFDENHNYYSNCSSFIYISKEIDNYDDNFDILYNNLAKTLHMTPNIFKRSLKNININKIIMSAPFDKINKCEHCDIQWILTEINKIHNNIKRNGKCYCKICSSFILYDPHCVCGIYDDWNL